MKGFQDSNKNNKNIKKGNNGNGVNENLNLLKSGDHLTFLIYTLISVIFGIMMVYLGMIIHKHFY